MNRIFLIPCTLIVAILTCAAHAQTYNLRGPAPSVGDTLRSESVVEMKEGTMNINAGGMQLAGKTSMTMRNTTETTIVEMEGDKVTKVRIRYVVDSQEQMVEMMGQRDTQNMDSPLHGQTVLGTHNDGTWTFQMDNGTANAAQRTQLAELGKNYKFNDKSSAYPDREVRIGESWDVAAEDLPSHFRGAQGVDGKVTLKLDKVEDVDGEPLAYLTLTLEFSSNMGAAEQGKMTMKAEGPVVRSLKNYVDNETKLNGTMEIAMKPSPEADVRMTGPMTFTGKESKP